MLPKTKEVILVVSDIMDNNQKPARHENALVRMASNTRKNLGLAKASGVFSENNTNLEVFHAFTKDISRLREHENFSNDDLKKVGFVTNKTFKKICGNVAGKTRKILISEESFKKIQKEIVKPKPKKVFHKEPVLIGADPEFLLVNKESGEVVEAKNVLGFDDKASKIGSDGGMAELRPNPSASVNGLIVNITDLLENDLETEKINNYRWKAACFHDRGDRDFPVGGHLHFSTTKAMQEMANTKRKLLMAMTNKAIDELLAVPMSRLDGTQGGGDRRTNCKMVITQANGYGFFGEWRTCNDKDGYHLENRTLSGLWLTHPTLAFAVVGAAKAIVSEIHTLAIANEYKTDYICPKCNYSDFAEAPEGNPKTAWRDGFDGWKDIPLLKDLKCTKSSKVMNDLLNACSAKAINKTYVNKWLSTMKQFSSFGKYEDSIRTLAEILKVPIVEFSNFTKNIRKNWLRGNKFIV